MDCWRPTGDLNIPGWCPPFAEKLSSLRVRLELEDGVPSSERSHMEPPDDMLLIVVEPKLPCGVLPPAEGPGFFVLRRGVVASSSLSAAWMVHCGCGEGGGLLLPPPSPRASLPKSIWNSGAQVRESGGIRERGSRGARDGSGDVSDADSCSRFTPQRDETKTRVGAKPGGSDGKQGLGQDEEAGSKNTMPDAARGQGGGRTGPAHPVGSPEFSPPAWDDDEAKQVDGEEGGGVGRQEERLLKRHVVEYVLCGPRIMSWQTTAGHQPNACARQIVSIVSTRDVDVLILTRKGRMERTWVTAAGAVASVRRAWDMCVCVLIIHAAGDTHAHISTFSVRRQGARSSLQPNLP